jgi:hypothetical protein
VRIPFYQDPEFLRLQTWLLLLALVLLALTFAIPVASFVPTGGGNPILLLAHTLVYPADYPADQQHGTTGSIVFFILALGVCMVLVASAVWQYRNRHSQLFVCRFAAVALVVMGAFGFWYVQQLAGALGGPGYTAHIEPGTYLRVAALACVVAAERLVVRDQRRIQAMNRFW